MGGNGSFWCRIKVTKQFPEAAALREPVLQGLKLSSMCPISTAAPYPLLYFLCALANPSSLNLSPHHSVSSLPSVFPQVSWQPRVVCAVFELQTPACQRPANSLNLLLLHLHKTLLCPADGSCGHSRWDPPHPTCFVESPTVAAAQVSIIIRGI